jgi:excisionase family DNA binding protein
MMDNPFAILDRRIGRLESLLLEVKAALLQAPPTVADVGGIGLAQEVTGLSKNTIYALVSKREIPHSKRGNKLYFNRAELLLWVAAGNRAVAGAPGHE